MQFTFQQKLGMSVGFIGAATSAFGALGPIMTSKQTLIGTVIFGFISACLGVVNTITSSQGQQIKTVASFDDVEKVNIKASAPPSIASIAVDQAQPKVGAANPETRTQLLETAKGT